MGSVSSWVCDFAVESVAQGDGQGHIPRSHQGVTEHETLIPRAHIVVIVMTQTPEQYPGFVNTNDH